MAQIKFRDHFLESELYEKSQEYFDLQKDLIELSLMERYIDNQLFLKENQDILGEYKFEEGFFPASISNDSLQLIMEDANNNSQGIMDKFGASIKKFWNACLQFWHMYLTRKTEKDDSARNVIRTRIINARNLEDKKDAIKNAILKSWDEAWNSQFRFITITDDSQYKLSSVTGLTEEVFEGVSIQAMLENGLRPDRVMVRAIIEGNGTLAPISLEQLSVLLQNAFQYKDIKNDVINRITRALNEAKESITVELSKEKREEFDRALSKLNNVVDLSIRRAKEGLGKDKEGIEKIRTRVTKTDDDTLKKQKEEWNKKYQAWEKQNPNPSEEDKQKWLKQNPNPEDVKDSSGEFANTGKVTRNIFGRIKTSSTDTQGYLAGSSYNNITDGKELQEYINVFNRIKKITSLTMQMHANIDNFRHRLVWNLAPLFPNPNK